MLMNTKVLMAAIIGGVLIVISLIGGLVYLAAKNADASTLLALVSTMVVIVNTIITVSTKSAMNQLQNQTNGTQSKLIDAAINSTPPERNSN